MKKKLSVVLLLLCISLVITTACKKDKEVTPEQTVEEQLTSTTWVNQSITYTEDGVDVTNVYDAFYQTMSATFSANGTYSISSSSYGAITSGTWVISNDETTLTATDTTTSDVFVLTIVSISSTSLHLTFNYVSTSLNVDVDIDATFIPI